MGARALCLAHAGRHGEAATIREGFAGIEHDDDSTGFVIILHLLEAATLGRDLDTVEVLAKRIGFLAPYPYAMGDGTCFARILGDASAILGKHAEAEAYYRQALAVCKKAGFLPEIALANLHLADLLLSESPDRWEEAATLLRATTPDLRQMGMQPSLQRALELQSHIARKPGCIETTPGGLTEREIDVLALVARGMSDREIAGALSISPRTVGNHISNILNRTGATNRAEAAVFATRYGLI